MDATREKYAPKKPPYPSIVSYCRIGRNASAKCLKALLTGESRAVDKTRGKTGAGILSSQKFQSILIWPVLSNSKEMDPCFVGGRGGVAWFGD